jgi:hypothetical protein
MAELNQSFKSTHPKSSRCARDPPTP